MSNWRKIGSLPSHGRRQFIKQTGAMAGLAAAGALPFQARASGLRSARIELPYGVQAGDVLADRAVIWSCADRPARMWVELADNPDFANARKLRGPAALPEAGLTTKLDVTGLQPDTRVFYRVYFEDLLDPGSASEAMIGALRTPPKQDLIDPARLTGKNRRSVRFLWSGDVAGQGWGINPAFGGMRIFETMRRQQPDFFIHSGDSIYADGPIQPQVTLPDDSIWHNLVTPAKSQVAETLEQFRGNYQYNLMDENLRRFNAEVPLYAQWDDHEVLNNWYPGERLGDPRYTETHVDLLAARAHRAFIEYMPVRFGERNRLFQHFPYGPLLDIFRIDLRSFRGPNNGNKQPTLNPDIAYFGTEQLAWLKTALRKSCATWKVIAADLPIGLVVPDGIDFENDANGDNGPPLGRELEVADLLRFIKQHTIQNVVWLTADVHYTAAHYYHPDRAGFKDFLPFWEFVSGPLNAGTFGPSKLDATFGPQVVFQKAPPAGQSNLSPAAGLQFFGQVDIDGASRVMTVTLKDIDGNALFSRSLMPIHSVALNGLVT